MANQQNPQPKIVVGFRGTDGSVGDILYLYEGVTIDEIGEYVIVRGEKGTANAGPIIATLPTEAISFCCKAEAFSLESILRSGPATSNLEKE